jgi:hypothetical protein
MPKPQLPFRRFERYGKGLRKKLSRFKPRNLLKSLDSDERIQANPRQSDLMGRAFRAKTARAKKTQTDRPDQGRGPLPRRSQPTPSKGKRLGPGSFSHAERLAFADRRALWGQSAGARADPPPLPLAIEPNQMIGGAIARVTRGRGG